MMFTTGQPVRIAYNGQAIDGTVLLASTNGISLMLSFEGVLRGPDGGLFPGMIPVLRSPNGDFLDLIEHGLAVLETRS